MYTIADNKLHNLIKLGRYFMSTKDNNDNVQNSENATEQKVVEPSKTDNTRKPITLNTLISLNTILSALTVVIPIAIPIIVVLTSLNKSVTEISVSMIAMQDRLDRLDAFYNAQTEWNMEMVERVTRLEERQNISKRIRPSDLLIASSNQIVSDVPLHELSKPVISEQNTIIASDFENNKELSQEDLVNQPITFSYTDSESGDLIFFKGQYNENGFWTGNCIVNRYSGNTLTMIMDAEYSNGMLLSYKQVLADISDRDIDNDGANDLLWTISERKPDGDVNIGETWRYFRTSPYKMQFDPNSFSEEDILTKDDFCDSMLGQLTQEGYYNGYTANGEYNDNTGNACLVRYSYDGYVRFLYVGCVKGGLPNDNTGNAWSISFGYDNTYYYYFEGIYNNNEHNQSSEQNPRLTQAEIDAIVGQYDFDCELTWRPTE